MKQKIDTLCVQAGYQPKSGEPRIAPIVQSTTYPYEKAQEMADIFDQKSDGYFYTRIANPTVAAFEGKVAALEGGVAAVGCASGMSATTLAVLTVCESGDNIVSSTAVYGGTFNLFKHTLPRLGISCSFFDMDDSAESIDALVTDKTKIIFCETIANPAITVADFDKLATICKKHNILFFVDNTLASPALCRPIEWGANVVLHSSSKYLDGHATALGGVIVDCGNFNFAGNPRYPSFNTPDETYHGLVYAERGNAAFCFKCRCQMIRDLGAIMSPMNAFLSNLGCDTLALRMQRHSQNAIAVAEFLENHPKVEWVKYAGLKSSPLNQRAQKYLPNGQGGMLSFGVVGGAAGGVKLMESLKLITQETHVADVRSCVLHPATTTHRQLSEAELAAAGVPANLIRLSVGIEAKEDIIADLAQALDNI